MYILYRIFYVNNGMAVRLLRQNMTFLAHDMINIAFLELKHISIVHLKSIFCVKIKREVHHFLIL